MADYAFIAQPQTPDSFKTIGSLLNMAQGAQNLQRGGIQLQQERELMQPNIEAGKARAATSQTGAQSAELEFRKKQQGIVADVLGGLLQDPNVQSNNADGIVKALAEARKQIVARGVPEANAEWGISLLQSKAHEPGAVQQSIQNLIRQAAGTTPQANVINAPLTSMEVATPNGVQKVGVQLQPGAPGALQPAQPAGPAGFSVGVPPTQTEQTGQDALGRPIVVKRNQSGQLSYEAPAGTSYRPVMQLPQGETAQTAAPLFALRDEAQRAAATAPSEHFNNQQILSLSDDAFTGTGSEALKKILGAVAIQSTNSAAADTARLQHFLSLQVENNAKAQGANTDAARNLAANAVVPGSSPAAAIKSVTKINDAYVTGKELFNQGLVKAINDPSNQKDIFAARDFQNAWSQNFDPNVMRIINAQKSGDTKELDQIKKELGPNGMKALIPKYQALKSLYEMGHP